MNGWLKEGYRTRGKELNERKCERKEVWEGVNLFKGSIRRSNDVM
jgi:hypothetical protein